MPQMILRNAVRSGDPGVTITGATAFPVSQRLRSERNSFFNSPTLRFPTGFAPLTSTTIGSLGTWPEAGETNDTGVIIIATARAKTANTGKINGTLFLLFIAVSVKT